MDPSCRTYAKIGIISMNDNIHPMIGNVTLFTLIARPIFFHPVTVQSENVGGCREKHTLHHGAPSSKRVQSGV